MAHRTALLLASLLATAVSAAPPACLRVMTHEWGIDFRHRSGPSLLFNPEVIGPGVALPDLDVVNGGEVGSDRLVALHHPDALYRNLGGGRFAEVAALAGVAGRGIGNGVLAADLDNDGYVDLVLTGYDEALLFRNNGDG